VTEGSDFFGLAINEIAATARIASEIMAAMPTNTDTLAGFPVRNVSTHCVNAPCDFVSWNTRILNTGPMAFLDQLVTVADAAGFNFNADLVSARLGNVSLDEFKIAAGFADLHSLHSRHSLFLMKLADGNANGNRGPNH
jgi:hypothetical protein